MGKPAEIVKPEGVGPVGQAGADENHESDRVYRESRLSELSRNHTGAELQAPENQHPKMMQHAERHGDRRHLADRYVPGLADPKTGKKACQPESGAQSQKPQQVQPLAPEEAPAENAQSFAARLQTALKRR